MVLSLFFLNLQVSKIIPIKHIFASSIISCYFVYQFVAIPIIRSQDNYVVTQIKSLTGSTKKTVVLFQNSWDTFLNPSDFNMGLPGLRGPTPEIFESFFSSYMWEMQYVKLFAGAHFSSGFFSIMSNGSYQFTGALFEPHFFVSNPENVIVVKNFSSTQPIWTRALYDVKVLPSLNDWSLLPSSKFYLSDLTNDRVLGTYSAGNGVGEIRLENNRLFITNESSSTVEGFILGNLLEAKSWNVSGKFSADGKQLYWSNGVTWLRK
jgi:hypothetical protein